LFNRKSLLIIIAGLAIGTGLGFAILALTGNTPEFLKLEGSTWDPGSSGPMVGSPAPDFDLETLSGEHVRLSDMRGKPVLINFWATWCVPCRTEMPFIQTRYEQANGKLAVLAVNYDEPKIDVQQFADELGLTFDVLLDPGAKTQDLYRVHGYPTTYIVDADGIIKIQQIGEMTNDQLGRYLTQVGVGG
jgi:peroxiredoxin